MTQNDAVKLHKCAFCTYETKRKYDLKRHQNAKHNTNNNNFCDTNKIVQNVSPNVQNVPPNVQNVPPNVQNVPPSVQNVPPTNLHCQKCNKLYKTIRHLKNHELNCKKVDNLTCPKCMVSFTNRKHKSRHIKADKCKARSIIYARTPNVQNITNNINNNIQNTNITNNQFIINNFGSERLDHISHEDIVRILTSGQNTIPLYIEKKHFDKQFPENNNIKYTLENKCKVFENNTWKEKDIGLLSSSLIKDNTEVLLLYCDDNDIKVSDTIRDTEKYDHIRNKLFIIYNKTDDNKYNVILSKIKELIKNSDKEI